MPTGLDGLIAGIVSVLDGTVGYLIIKSFVDGGVISPIWLVVYALVNVGAIFIFAHASKYWGTIYLLGYWFGYGLMWYSGLVELWEFVLSSVILLIVLITRILHR